MPVAKFQLPDGKIARFEVPEGADLQALQSEVNSMYERGQLQDTAPKAPVDQGKGNYYRNLQRSLLGGAEVAASVLSSAAAEPLAGISGLVNAAVPGGPTGPEAIESVRNAFRYEPRSARGQQMLRSTGEALEPVGEAIGAVESYLGDKAFEKTGSPALAAAATTIPTVIAELLGVVTLKSASGVSKAVKSQKIDDLIEAAAPTTEQLRQVASALYKEVDEMGAVVDPNQFRRLAYEIAADAQKSGADSRITPASSAVVQEIFETAKRGDIISLEELNTFREMAKGAAGKVTDKHEAMLGSAVVEKIDDFMGSSGIISADMSKSVGPAVGARLKAARELWGRMRRSELLEEADYKAQNQASGYENGLRTQFRSILNNKKHRKFFKPEEIKTMEDVVRGTTGSNMLKRLGKLGFGEGGASNMLGGSLAASAAYAAGGIPAAVATATVGTAARKGAQILTDRRTRMADSLVRAGTDARSVAAQYLKSTSKPDPAELADIFLKRDIIIPDAAELDEFTKASLQIARQRQAELAAAASAGSVERGTSQNIIPYSLGR